MILKVLEVVLKVDILYSLIFDTFIDIISSFIKMIQVIQFILLVDMTHAV